MHLSLCDSPFSKADLAPLVEAIQEQYGYDFRNYNASSLGRRIKLTMAKARIETLPEFQQRLVQDASLFRQLVEDVSITVTAMFRDPAAFRILRDGVLPALATYPHIRVWCAGVASGEEAYSIAILLAEHDLTRRATIYATDFNPALIRQAARGCFPLERMADYTRNYVAAGGQRPFSTYYRSSTKLAYMHPRLRNPIVFSTHNLASDSTFNEFHLILCRNVLIYFDSGLADRAVGLFRESLASGCYLFLGQKEHLQPRGLGRFFDVFSQPAVIYRKP